MAVMLGGFVATVTIHIAHIGWLVCHMSDPLVGEDPPRSALAAIVSAAALMGFGAAMQWRLSGYHENPWPRFFTRSYLSGAVAGMALGAIAALVAMF